MLHSFLHFHVGEDLRHTWYGFDDIRTWASVMLSEVLLTLFIVWNAAESVQRSGSETKRSDAR